MGTSTTTPASRSSGCSVTSIALLPAHGDPFCLKHQLLNYDRVWRGEVDELHVLVSGQPDQEVLDYMRELVEDMGGIFVGGVGATMDHGVAIRLLAEGASGREHDDEPTDDVFMLLESDARVCKPGEIAERVNLISGNVFDVIGSPRGSMSGGLLDACYQRYGLMFPTQDGCVGYGLWPCFLFISADVMLYDTDRNYGARGWVDGEEVVGLPGTRAVGSEWCADTFGSAALQLRLKHTIKPDVQFHGPWLWEGQLNQGMVMPWFHTGSLSSWGGAGGLTVDGDSQLMDGRRLTDEMELYEWGHRVAWWERFLSLAGDDLPRHQENYRRNMDRTREIMGIEDHYVLRWKSVLDRLVTWREHL